MKNIIYFSHDVRAVFDPKISCMRGRYGLEGYGLFWAIVERMRENESTGFRLPLDIITFGSLETDLRPSFDIREFVDRCIDEYKLFESDGKWFWSVSLCSRMQTKAKISETNKQNARKKYSSQSIGNDVADCSECDLPEPSCEDMANALRPESEKQNSACETEEGSCDVSQAISEGDATDKRHVGDCEGSQSESHAFADKGKGKGKSLDITPLPPSKGEGRAKRSTRPKVQASELQMALFEKFWAVWPKPVSRGQAEKTWAKLEVTEDLAEKIIRGVERAKKYDNRFREARYIPHPSTWLNAKGWLDKFGKEDERNEGSKFGGVDPGLIL